MACRWTRLACERHLRDLDRWAAADSTFSYWWDADEVEDWRLYFLGLRHSKGRWAKPTPQRIVLEPWQLFVLGSLWAWKKPDGMRRFREAYIEVPRKQTKSTMASGVGLRLAFDDDEPGAEVYAVATKLKQARVVWDEAKRMVQHAPRLRERVVALALNLHDPASASKFEPLGADSEKLDGLNVHGATVDELHAHDDPEMWTVIDTGTGARDQPLIFAITTAGFNRAGICYDRRTYLTKILERVINDESVFGTIYTIDADDDWRDPRCWPKATPMLGITVKQEELEQQCRRAVEIPSTRTAFLTKRLNVWVNVGTAEVDLLAWARGATTVTLEALAGVPCWIGVDLASKSDLAAVVAAFVREDHCSGGRCVTLSARFYLPREGVADAAHAATAHYATWKENPAHLTLTEGDLIDFGVIREDIAALAKVVACQEIDIDPYNSTHLTTELRDLGLTTVEIPQTVKQLSGPMYAVRDLLKAGRLHHDGNPVMAWCCSNVESREDANGNLFPRKASRNLKIDGYSAMLDALSRALVHEAAPQPRITVIG